MASSDDLHTYIFGDRSGRLPERFALWLTGSRRFRAFADRYRDKIRKKVRTRDDENALLDLEAELAMANLLLQHKRLSVTYETHAAGQRGPDFAVELTSGRVIHVEVTRIRALELLESSAVTPRLMDCVLEKVGQMPAQTANALVVASGVPVAPEALRNAMTSLRLSAERKYENFFTRRGFADAAEFLRQFRNLSAVGVWLYPPPPDGEDIALWHNALAKQRLPRELVNVLDPSGGPLTDA